MNQDFITRQMTPVTKAMAYDSPIILKRIAAEPGPDIKSMLTRAYNVCMAIYESDEHFEKKVRLLEALPREKGGHMITKEQLKQRFISKLNHQCTAIMAANALMRAGAVRTHLTTDWIKQ